MATTRKPRVKANLPGDIADDAPSVMSLKPGPKRKVEWRDAFEINGTMYKIRSHAEPNMGLRYIRLYRTQGESIANDFMLNHLLAPDAYEALMGFDGLTTDDLLEVLKHAVTIMLGRVESPN